MESTRPPRPTTRATDRCLRQIRCCRWAERRPDRPSSLQIHEVDCSFKIEHRAAGTTLLFPDALRHGLRPSRPDGRPRTDEIVQGRSTALGCDVITQRIETQVTTHDST